MRNRNVNELAPLKRTYWAFDGTVTQSTVGEFRRRGDFLSSGAIIKGNRINPNPWSFTKRIRYSDDMSASWVSPPDNLGRRASDLYVGPYAGVPENLVSDLPSLQDQARAAAYSDLLDQIRSSDLDLSIDIIQARQTATLHRDTAKAVKGLASIAKLIPAANLALTLKKAGNAWLTFQYGVKPTLQSIYDVSKFNAQHYSNAYKAFVGRGRVQESRKVTLTNWPDANFWSGVCELQISVRSRYYAVLKIPNDTLTQAARLSSLNPASIAWEAVPYSFVVDWFYNLGGYLREVETRAIYARFFTAGFRTDTYSIDHSARSTRDHTTASGDRFTGSYVVRGSDRGLDRSLIYDLPNPQTPKFLPKLGSQRLLSAASLLSTFLRGKS